MRIWRYWALGKFGEHLSRVRVALGCTSSNSYLHICTLTHEPIVKCFLEMNVRKCQGINFKSQQTWSTCMIRGWSSTRRIPWCAARFGLPIKYIFPRLTPPKAQSIIKVTEHYKWSRWKKESHFTWRFVPLYTDEWRNWQDEEKSFSTHKRDCSQARNVQIVFCFFFFLWVIDLFITINI